MNREALNIALQALETLMIERGSIYDKAITAIKEALADPSPNFNCKSVQARLATAWGYVKAQPEQEPVAWYRDEDGIRIYYETKCWDDAIPLYTAPHHTWVGLTFDERIELAQDVDWAAGAYCEYAEKIEAKLKEKNT